MLLLGNGRLYHVGVGWAVEQNYSIQKLYLYTVINSSGLFSQQGYLFLMIDCIGKEDKNKESEQVLFIDVLVQYWKDMININNNVLYI